MPPAEDAQLVLAFDDNRLALALFGQYGQNLALIERRLGVTMIYVTHDQVEAMTMADRIVLMRAGQVEQHGTPEELYDRPATVFTARFVGTPPMNVLPLAVIGEAAARFAPAGRDIGSVSLGVRPEHVRLSDQGIHATVTAVEYLGADSLIDARVGEAGFVVRVPGKVAVGEGATVGLDWDLADTHHFDTASGRRIA